MVSETNTRPRIIFFGRKTTAPDGGEATAAPWSRGYEWVARQPSWPTRAAAIAFMIVVGLPLLLLFFFAMLVATVVFGVLLLVYKVRRLFQRDPAGRENVQVVVRDPHE